MAQYTDSVRARARQLYEDTDQPVRSIAAELGIGDNTLQRMKISGGWARRCERLRGLPTAVQLLEEAKALAATVAVAADSGENENPAIAEGAAKELDPRLRGDDRPGDASAIDRLEALVVSAIAAQEAAKAQFVGKRRTATVSERSARTLATLTQTLRALRQMRNGALPDTEPLNDDSHDRDDMPRDLDEFRHALARRIRAFVESRIRARDADGNSGRADVDAAGQ